MSDLLFRPLALSMDYFAGDPAGLPAIRPHPDHASGESPSLHGTKDASGESPSRRPSPSYARGARGARDGSPSRPATVRRIHRQ